MKCDSSSPDEKGYFILEEIPSSDEVCVVHFRVTMQGCIPLFASKVIIKEPPAKTKPGIDPVLLVASDPQRMTDSFVYVHCYFQNEWKDALVRIWKTTFLVDYASGSKSGLVHAENISIAPLWMLIPDNTTHRFLLIFAALPKSCSQFDLIEEIPQPGGFHVKSIQRNHKDVYHIEV